MTQTLRHRTIYLVKCSRGSAAIRSRAGRAVWPRPSCMQEDLASPGDVWLPRGNIAAPSGRCHGLAGSRARRKAFRQRVRERLAVQDSQAGNGAGQCDVQPLQAACFGGGNLGGLNDDDVVELQALGKADRNDDELAERVVAIE